MEKIQAAIAAIVMRVVRLTQSNRSQELLHRATDAKKRHD